MRAKCRRPAKCGAAAGNLALLCEPRAFAVGKSGRYSGNRVFHIDI